MAHTTQCDPVGGLRVNDFGKPRTTCAMRLSYSEFRICEAPMSSETRIQPLAFLILSTHRHEKQH